MCYLLEIIYIYRVVRYVLHSFKPWIQDYSSRKVTTHLLKIRYLTINHLNNIWLHDLPNLTKPHPRCSKLQLRVGLSWFNWKHTRIVNRQIHYPKVLRSIVTFFIMFLRRGVISFIIVYHKPTQVVYSIYGYFKFWILMMSIKELFQIYNRRLRS